MRGSRAAAVLVGRAQRRSIVEDDEEDYGEYFRRSSVVEGERRGSIAFSWHEDTDVNPRSGFKLSKIFSSSRTSKSQESHNSHNDLHDPDTSFEETMKRPAGYAHRMSLPEAFQHTSGWPQNQQGATGEGACRAGTVLMWACPRLEGCR